MIVALHNFQIGQQRAVVERGCALADAAADFRHGFAAHIGCRALIALGRSALTHHAVEGELLAWIENQTVERLGRQLDVVQPCIGTGVHGGHFFAQHIPEQAGLQLLLGHLRLGDDQIYRDGFTVGRRVVHVFGLCQVEGHAAHILSALAGRFIVLGVFHLRRHGLMDGGQINGLGVCLLKVILQLRIISVLECLMDQVINLIFIQKDSRCTFGDLDGGFGQLIGVFRKLRIDLRRRLGDYCAHGRLIKCAVTSGGNIRRIADAADICDGVADKAAGAAVAVCIFSRLRCAVRHEACICQSNDNADLFGNLQGNSLLAALAVARSFQLLLRLLHGQSAQVHTFHRYIGINGVQAGRKCANACKHSHNKEQHRAHGNQRNLPAPGHSGTLSGAAGGCIGIARLLLRPAGRRVGRSRSALGPAVRICLFCVFTAHLFPASLGT